MLHFFRHYKNKPYRYIGTAKHSETLEDLALYECLYENPLGKIWVRPKRMFFEKVQIEGRTQDRFEKINFRFESSQSTEYLPVVTSLCQQIFSDFDQAWMQSVIQAHTQLHTLIALEGDKPVAFKMGYARNCNLFYSWLGGVLPAYRRVGLGTALMKLQHEWVQSQGFARIETRTRNKFPEMIYLNLKMGFQIVGCQSDSGAAGPKIIMEKRLSDADR